MPFLTFFKVSNWIDFDFIRLYQFIDFKLRFFYCAHVRVNYSRDHPPPGQTPGICCMISCKQQKTCFVTSCRHFRRRSESRVSSSQTLSFWSRWRTFIDNKRPIKAIKPFALSLFSRSNSFRDLFYAVLLSWNRCFYQKWQLIILYINPMNWGAGYLIIIVGTEGGAFAKNISRRTGNLNIFFQMPGSLHGGRGCSRLELTHTLPL